MSGHSKWSTIKRKKGAADTKRGQLFTKLGNAIAVAAKNGVDSATNPALALAIEKAKVANMPNANIERSIKRGRGELGGAAVEEVTYEGYGPGGVAILAQCATDNRNRTASEVRSVFTKHGGNLAEPGAVAFQFEQKGVLVIQGEDREAAILAAIDAGAEDIEENDSTLTLYTNPKSLNDARTNLKEAGYAVESAELSYEAKQKLSVEDEETARKVLKLLDALEDLDDVVTTYSNFDIPTEVLEKVG